MKLSHLAPLTLILGLAACSPSPSTAAIVGDTTITQAELDEYTAGCREAGLKEEDVPKVALLNSLIRKKIGADLVAEKKLDISDEKLRDHLDQSGGRNLLSYPKCAELAISELRMKVILQLVPEKEIIEWIAGVDVELNPRYGQWQVEQGSIGGSGSLSEKVE